jgi:hypothetical protein
MLAPENSGGMYYNYKGIFHVVLSVVMDVYDDVILADMGC